MIQNLGPRIMLGGLLTAMAATFAVAQPAPAAGRGAALYVSKGCYECHGLAAQGAFVVGPALSPLRPPLAVFSAYIRAPVGQMPPYGLAVLSQSEVEDIFAYLRGLPKAPGAAQITILAPYVAKPCEPAANHETCGQPPRAPPK